MALLPMLETKLIVGPSSALWEKVIVVMTRIGNRWRILAGLASWEIVAARVR